MIAVHRITSPSTITSRAANFSQCPPPNIFLGPVALIHWHAVTEVAMTIHRISSEPRSCTFPVLRLVRVTIVMMISEANQLQKSTSQNVDSVIMSPLLEAGHPARAGRG